MDGEEMQLINKLDRDETEFKLELQKVEDQEFIRLF